MTPSPNTVTRIPNIIPGYLVALTRPFTVRVSKETNVELLEAISISGMDRSAVIRAVLKRGLKSWIKLASEETHD